MFRDPRSTKQITLLLCSHIMNTVIKIKNSLSLDVITIILDSLIKKCIMKTDPVLGIISVLPILHTLFTLT